MTRTSSMAVVALVAGLALAGCSTQLGDRGGQEGAPPDKVGDVDYVEVFRNADEFPNVARICIEGVAFAATSSTTPALIRMPEWDAKCPGAAAPSGPPTPTAAPTTPPG